MGFYLSVFFIGIISLLISINNTINFKISKNKCELFYEDSLKLNLIYLFVCSFIILTMMLLCLRIIVVFINFNLDKPFDVISNFLLIVMCCFLFFKMIFSTLYYIVLANEETHKTTKDETIISFEIKETNQNIISFNLIKEYVDLSLKNLSNKKSFDDLKTEILLLEKSILDVSKSNVKQLKKQYINNINIYKKVSLMLMKKDLLNEYKIKNIIIFIKENKIDYKIKK